MDTKERTSFAVWMRAHWALIPVLVFYLAAAVVYLFAGEHAKIAVSDNLDLFQSQYQMLRLTDSFYAKDASSLFLNGISRDVLPSEFSLTSLLYQIFPPLAAYELLYFVKITIAIVSFGLLAGELGRRGLLEGPATGSCSARWNLSVLCGLAFGVLNLFPSFGICFASIPLLLWLVLRLEGEEKRGRCCLWLVGILFYPWLSYFSYFGFFLIAYLCGAFLFKSVIDSVRERGFHPDLRLLAAAAALSAGTVACEYRLFTQMLLSDEVTIRETMVQGSYGAGQVLGAMLDVFINGVDMHCESVHKWIVLPVCLIYLVIHNVTYRETGNAGRSEALRGTDKSTRLCERSPHDLTYRKRAGRFVRAATDLYNLAFLTLVFNCAIYGLYYCEPFRGLIETLLPPLKGFQFNRTAFFNPFLWYGMFFLALYRLFLWTAERREIRAAGTGAASEVPSGRENPGPQKGIRAGSPDLLGRFAVFAPWVLAFAAVLVILFSGTTYNDLLNTAKADVKRILKMEPSDELDYAEFYSEELFAAILEDICYDGEWSVAYGLHPAILNYNGISTLDGYLGFYSQEYKEAFRRVIAPALEENEATRIYYDDWGARCYLYSGHNTTIVEAVRHYTHPEDTIDIDADALRDLGCTYIFSRIRLTNADEKGLTLVGTYTNEDSPYTIYVYAL